MVQLGDCIGRFWLLWLRTVDLWKNCDTKQGLWRTVMVAMVVDSVRLGKNCSKTGGLWREVAEC